MTPEESPEVPEDLQHEGLRMLNIREQSGFHIFTGRTIIHGVHNTVVSGNGKMEKFEGSLWLEEVLIKRRPIGFDMEWKPDRGDTSNGVALMQFADGDTVLLLRTHKTRWLPRLVTEVLESAVVKKACVGYDGNDRKKMQQSFGFVLSGVIDLGALAEKKGVAAKGLKSMAAEFGWMMEKAKDIGRSDWAADFLSERQERYAVEDAFFTFKLLEALQSLPDLEVPVSEDVAAETLNSFSILPGWTEQGIERKDDGLYCNICPAGPMLNSDNVKAHIKSRKHQNKVNPPETHSAASAIRIAQVEEALNDEMRARGIVKGSMEHARARPGEFFCDFCDAGPFQCLAGVQDHLKGKTHAKKEKQKGLGPKEELPPELAAQGIEEDGSLYCCRHCDVGIASLDAALQHVQGGKHKKKVTAVADDASTCDSAKTVSTSRLLLTSPSPSQSYPATPPRPTRGSSMSPESQQLPEPVSIALLPGYVAYFEDSLFCSLCEVKLTEYLNALQHLTSAKHNKKCRQTGRPELIYAPERQRLEIAETNEPIYRVDDVFVPPKPRPKAPQSPRAKEPQEFATPPRSRTRSKELFHEDSEPPRPPPPAADEATAEAWAHWSGRAAVASASPVWQLPAALPVKPWQRNRESPETLAPLPLPSEPWSLWRAAHEVPELPEDAEEGEEAQQTQRSEPEGQDETHEDPADYQADDNQLGQEETHEHQDELGIRILEKGDVCRVTQEVKSPPSGYDRENFLVLDVSDMLEVIYREEDWVWVKTLTGRMTHEGWAPLKALEVVQHWPQPATLPAANTASTKARGPIGQHSSHAASSKEKQTSTQNQRIQEELRLLSLPIKELQARIQRAGLRMPATSAPEAWELVAVLTGVRI